MTECPFIEKLREKGLLKNIPLDRLIEHWYSCDICTQNVKALVREDMEMRNNKNKEK